MSYSSEESEVWSVKSLSRDIMLKAFGCLNKMLEAPLTLIVGGGGAMILAHAYPLATAGIDAVPKGMDLAETDKVIKKVAKDLNLPGDWLNPYFSTFSHVLPQDYGSRLVNVFSEKKLTALALGKEDLLVMKCFAHRAKDILHAKALIKSGVDTSFVEEHIIGLQETKVPGSDEALDFLDELLDGEA